MLYATIQKAFTLLVFLILSIGIYISPSQAQCTVPNTICAGGACDSGPSRFQYGPSVNTDFPLNKYEWSFEDGDTTNSRKEDPIHIYTEPGNYTVTLTVTFPDGTTETCSTPITVKGASSFVVNTNLSDKDLNKGEQEEEVCIDYIDNGGLVLRPGFKGQKPTNATYLWSNGSTIDSLAIDTAGCYSVTVTVDGCSRTNKVNIIGYKPDPDQPAPPQERGRWYFGNGAGMKFFSDTTQVLTDGKVNGSQSSSSVSDASGKLLFYSDGQTVWDTLGTPLPNIPPLAPPATLNGGLNSTQGVLIVAQPGCSQCNSVYYVFTTSDITATGSKLEYNIVDMRLNGQKGAIVQQNSPLFDASTERLTAIKKESTGDPKTEVTWIITHDFKTNAFRVIPLTAQGIGDIKTYNVGMVHGGAPEMGEGYLKPNADGSRIAVVIPGKDTIHNFVQLFDFDKQTGEVSNPTTIDLGLTPPKAFGLEFSGSKMYVSLQGDGTPTAPSRLLQFDLTNKDSLAIVSSKDTIASSDKLYGAIQLDPNGQKIFMALSGKDSLAVINNPSVSETIGVGYKENGFYLGAGKTTNAGLPNVSPTETPPGFGQSFGFDGPKCASGPVQYQFQASPDRAFTNEGKDMSTYTWTFENGIPATSTEADPIVTFPGKGSYKVNLTIENDCKLEVLEEQVVTILEQPAAVDLGDPYSECSATTPVSLSITTKPEFKIDWFLNGVSITGASGKTSYLATQSGTYTVAVSNGICVELDQAVVSFDAPVVDLNGNTFTICGGETIVLDAGNPGATYEWKTPKIPSAIETTRRILTSTQGLYSVKVTANGCSTTATFTVQNGTSTALTEAHKDATGGCIGPVTANGSITLTSGAGPAITSYKWTGPSITAANTNSQNPTNLLPGTYSVIATNTTGCQTILSVSINTTINTVQYTASLTQPTCTQPTGTITLTASAGTLPNASRQFVWKDSKNNQIGTNSSTQSNLPADIYSVVITDPAPNACTFTISGMEIRPTVGAPVINPYTKIQCGQYVIYANATIPVGNPYTVEYRWLENNVPVSSLPLSADSLSDTPGNTTQPIIYTVTVTINGCSVTKSITINPADVARPVGDIIKPAPGGMYCKGETVTLEAGAKGVNYTYTWYKDDEKLATTTIPTIQVTEAGKYAVTVKNTSNGCESPVGFTRTLEFNDIPVADAGRNDTICIGSQSILSGRDTQNIPFVTYKWTFTKSKKPVPGGDVQRVPVSPNETTSYTLTVANKNRCTSTDTIIVVVKPQPKLNADVFKNISKCENEEISFDASEGATGVEDATYLWTPTGETTPKITSLQPGKTYTVTVTNGKCSDTKSVTVLPLRAAPKPSIPQYMVYLCKSEGDSVVLDAGPGDSGDNFTYEWKGPDPDLPLSITRYLTVREVGFYKVKIIKGTATSNCSVTETIEVKEACEPRLHVPNAFAPNGSGKNRELVFKGKYVTNLHVKIYNRWGEVIFAQNNIDTSDPENIVVWDGMYKNAPSPSGSYVMIVTYESAEFEGRKPITQRTGIMLLR